MRKLKEATKKLLRSNDRLLDLLMPSRRNKKQEVDKCEDEKIDIDIDIDSYVPVKFDKKTNTIIITSKISSAEIHLTAPPKWYKDRQWDKSIKIHSEETKLRKKNGQLHEDQLQRRFNKRHAKMIDLHGQLFYPPKATHKED